MSASSVPNGSPRQSSKKRVTTLTTPQLINTSGNVALYMRVSSEDQADRGTIEAQRDFPLQPAPSSLPSRPSRSAPPGHR